MLCYVMLCYVMLCYVTLRYVMLRYIMVTFCCDSGPTQIASRTGKHSTASIFLRFRDFQKCAQIIGFNATSDHLWALGMWLFPESWQPGMGENARDYLVFERFLWFHGNRWDLAKFTKSLRISPIRDRQDPSKPKESCRQHAPPRDGRKQSGAGILRRRAISLEFHNPKEASRASPRNLVSCYEN